MARTRYLVYVRMSPDGSGRDVVEAVKALPEIEPKKIFPSNYKEFDFFAPLKSLTLKELKIFKTKLAKIPGIEKYEIFSH